MQSFASIRSVYDNPDLLLEASRLDAQEFGKNLVVDISARARVISLEDTTLSYQDRTVYVPGKSYLIPFRELTNIFLIRNGLTYGPERKNINIEIINNLMSGNSVEDYLRNNLVLGQAERDRLCFWYAWNKESLKNMAEVFSLRRDNKREGGLVLLKEYDPIKSFESLDEKVMGMDFPLAVNARGAEFSFESDSETIVSDGESRVGRLSRGLRRTMSFNDLSLYVLEENVDSNNRHMFFHSVSPSKVPNFWAFNKALIMGGAISYALYFIPNHLPEMDLGLKSILYSSASLVAFYFGIKALRAIRPYELKTGNFSVLDFDASPSLMKIAFYGTLKDSV